MLLIDDERLSLQFMEKMLQDVEGLQLMGKYQDPRQALDDLPRFKPDVVFLDVEMPEMDGIEAAEEILRRSPDTDIVFVTAYEEYAVKAFELNALDYVLKPVQRERMLKTLMRIKKEKETSKNSTASGKLQRIHCFQSLKIEVSGRSPETIRWRTSKAQELFSYLVHRRGQPVRKDYLLELLWADVEWKKGYSQLYTTVYQIRKTLDQLGIGLKIINCENGYRLDISEIGIDVDEWESSMRRLPPIASKSLDEHLALIERYRGDYFADYDYLWAESERQRLRTDWYNHAEKVGNYLAANGEHTRAIALYLRMQQIQPHLEEIYFRLMKLFDTIGDREAVEGQYNRLTAMLRDEFDLVPRADIREWFSQWMSIR
ncbi:response regulator [Brevibacillus sp. B_LB10_24]|uniref:response regulator n=1 Tax=Brevibacillus sp. B_LB10_24 TaxID=3380645 RepID=UPI0038BC2F23